MGTKVYNVGKQLVDYDERKTGEHINGYKVFFFCKADRVLGHYADNVWIDAGRSPELFKVIDHLQIEDDFIAAEFVYQVIPGRRTQQLVEIRIDK